MVQRGMSPSSAFCRTVLKSKLDNGPPCVVPFLISIMSLSSSVKTVAFWSLSVSSGGRCNHVRYRRIWGHSKMIRGWWSQTPSSGRLSRSTFWFTTDGISGQSFCTSQDGLLFGKSFWIPPDIPLVFGRFLDIICCTVLSWTVYTTLAKSRSGGSFQRLPRLLICVSLSFSLSSMPLVWTRSALRFRWIFVSPFLSSHRRMLWCLRLWFRCCLKICLFWVCWLQFATLLS